MARPPAPTPEPVEPPSKSAFILRDALDPLRYDFRLEDGSTAPHGTIPEPSVAQIENFRRAIRKAFADIAAAQKKDTKAETDALARAFAEPTEAEKRRGAKANAALLKACVDVCSTAFTMDDLESLPYRAQRAFGGWLVGVMLDPKA